MSNIFNFSIIYDILIAAVPALICITIHELSHGYVAYRLGDNTAKDMGRLTLNPIKHIDILGLAMIVLVGFGWAKPVPVDMRSFKYPKRHMAITAFAGPASNLLLAFFVALIFMLLPFPHGSISAFAMMFTPYSQELPIITQIIFRLILINVFLAVFNLLPIPPLDGSKVLFALLPEKHYYTLMRYEQFGMIFLVLLVFVGRFLNFNIIGTIIEKPASSLLIWMGETAYRIVS